MIDFGSASSQLQSWPVYNTTSEEIPAFAAMRISGSRFVATDTDQRGQVVLEVAKANTFGAHADTIINGPRPIAAGGYGTYTAGEIVAALYDTADGTPAANEAWGPRNGVWKLKKNTGGYRIVGGVDSTNGVVIVRRAADVLFDGKTDAAHNKGADGTVSIWSGSSTTLSDTNENVTAYNRYGNVASGKWVKLVRQSHSWEIVAAEC